MSEFFNTKDQHSIMLDYFPTGKAFLKASEEGTNFFNLVKFIAQANTETIEKLNKNFKSNFICLSNDSIKQLKKDYNIPNNVFYLTDDEINRVDVFVLKHLMKGNTEWHYRAIANIYGLDILLGWEYGDRPTNIPAEDYPYDGTEKHTLFITFYPLPSSSFALEFDVVFGSTVEDKIKGIFDIIKPPHIDIVYKSPPYDVEHVDVSDYLPGDIPYKVGYWGITTRVFHNLDEVEMIKFCIKTESK